MNKTKNRLQQGFAVVELMIFVVVIVAVGCIGYWALRQSRAASYSPNIANIYPTQGLAGKTKIKFTPVSNFAGHYRVDVRKAGTTTWLTGVVRLVASANHKSLTNEDGSLWTFPTCISPKYGQVITNPSCTLTTDSKNTQQGYTAMPGTKWYIRLVDVNNPTGHAVIGTKAALFTVAVAATKPAVLISKNNLYMLGGSIFEKLANESDIKTKVKTNGWDLITYDAVGGRTLEEGLVVAQKEVSTVKKANDIVVFLGFNDENDTDQVFIPKLTALYGYLRSKNPNAKIYWLTYALYPTDSSASEKARKSNALRINKDIRANAAKYNITVLDWANVAKSSYYGPTDDVHPSVAGMAHLATYISQNIGKPAR